MMLFKPKCSESQGSVIGGRHIAHGRRSPSQRGAVAAQLHIGEVALVDPTIKQAAGLLGVYVPYVAAALDTTVEKRAALASGALTIPNLLKSSPSDRLVSAWNNCTNDERVEFAQRIGVARVWDEAIAPALD